MHISLNLPFLKFEAGKSQSSRVRVDDLIRRWEAGLDGQVSKSTAYKTAGFYYAAVNKISRNLSRVNVKIVNRNDKPVESGPIIELFQYINDYMDLSLFIDGVFVYKAIRGEAFIHCIGDGRTPEGFELLEPLYMRELVDKKTKDLIGWQYTAKGKSIDLLAENVIHIRYFNPFNVYRGLSPVNAAAQSLTLEKTDFEFQKRALVAGGPPAGIIEHPEKMDDPQFERLSQSYKEMARGKAGLMITEGGAKYREAKLTAQEMQTIERKKLSIDEILAVMEVPKAVVGLTDGFNYANMKEANQNFWSQKLIPEFWSFCRNFNTNFFDVRFGKNAYRMVPDFSNIPELQESLKELAASAKTYFDMGVPMAEINERLELGFDLTSAPWTGEWWIPFSMQPASSILAGGGPLQEEAAPDKFAELTKTIDSITTKIEDDEQEKQNYKIWKTLINEIDPIEKVYSGKIGRFIFNLRKEILKNFSEQVPADEVRATKQDLGEPLFNLDSWTEKFKAMSLPYLKEAMLKGGQSGFIDIGLEGNFTLNSPRMTQFIDVVEFQLKEPIQTVYTRTAQILQDGLNKGLPYDDIANNLKHELNIAKGRAKTIARTEVAHAANAAKQTMYEENDIKKSRWVHSFDANVRHQPESDFNHMINEITELGEEFSTGLKYPGDRTGSMSVAGNLINCRCITTAVLE